MFDADFLAILGLGFLLGARHALDADHIAAVSTLLSTRPSLHTSGFIGLCWGLGHTFTLLMVGLAVIFLKVAIPLPVAQMLEVGVGVPPTRHRPPHGPLSGPGRAWRRRWRASGSRRSASACRRWAPAGWRSLRPQLSRDRQISSLSRSQ